MICSLEKKNDFEQIRISNVLSFDEISFSILWKSDLRSNISGLIEFVLCGIIMFFKCFHSCLRLAEILETEFSSLNIEELSLKNIFVVKSLTNFERMESIFRIKWKYSISPTRTGKVNPVKNHIFTQVAFVLPHVVLKELKTFFGFCLFDSMSFILR
jgi:hypothetical protein